MKITLLVDSVASGAFAAEFGLSLLLERDGRTILFDTGAGAALVPNLNLLGLSADRIQEVVLSHGHYDHTGGLAHLKPQKIWCVPGSDLSHFSCHADGSIHDISMPENSVAVLKQSKAVYIRSFAEIADGIWLTGAIPRVSGEDCGGNFFREVQCRTGDTVPEEQALLTAEGTLISGCCHAGIINTLQYCREQHPEIPVRTIVGGLHLRHASAERLEKTAEFLRQTEIQEMYLFHCTGDNAVAELQKYLPGCKISSPVVGESWITP